jgi:branched-chain amino acid transport system permease protein
MTIKVEIMKPSLLESESLLNRQVVIASLVLALMLVAPLVLPPYWTFQLTGVLAYAVAALGLNLITGFVGQVSLGQNAFFALGAYTALLGVTKGGLGYGMAVLLAALVCFVFGVLAGFPVRRLKGLYLVLITLILAMSVAPLIKHFKDYTGGSAGLLFDRPSPPTWFALGQDAWIFYIVFAFTAVCFLLIGNFVSGSTGRALAGVREGELSASSMGVNVNRHKVLLFGVGSMLGGIGGALATFSIGFIGPDSFTLMLSISFLAATVVGGLGTITGSLIAGLFLQFVPSLASDLGQALSSAVYGGILIACIFLMPRGIAGSIFALFVKQRGKRK